MSVKSTALIGMHTRIFCLGPACQPVPLRPSVRALTDCQTSYESARTAEARLPMNDGSYTSFDDKFLIFFLRFQKFFLRGKRYNRQAKKKSKGQNTTTKKQQQQQKQQGKTLNNTVNVRGRRWATVKPQSC